MQIVDTSISLTELRQMATASFGSLVKAVVDVEKEILVVDAQLHADEEALLLTNGSKQEHIWGINIYPDLTGEDMIEFDSMINVRPAVGNNSRGIDDLKVQEKIRVICKKRIIL